MRTLLSYREARLLLAGQTLSAFGDWAMLIVLAVWMKSLTGSSALAGLTFFVFAAGSLLAPLGGVPARPVRRPLLLIGAARRAPGRPGAPPAADDRRRLRARGVRARAPVRPRPQRCVADLRGRVRVR